MGIHTGSSHRIAVGILMGIPTGFLWESPWGFPQEFYGDGMEWEFHSHGNPGINAFVLNTAKTLAQWFPTWGPWTP